MRTDHVANINFEEFYAPAFPNGARAQAFVQCVESISAQQSKAKIVLHQAARMLWLADHVEPFARGRPALLILFYVIAAEAVAKLVKGFQAEGESKKHVRLFFEDICSPGHRSILADAFRRSTGGSALTIRETVDLLYDVRCDVVHEGQYFILTLPEPSETSPLLTVYGGLSLIPKITAHQLRKIVLEGALLGAAQLLPAGSSCLSHLPAL